MDAIGIDRQEILKSWCWLLSARGSRSFCRRCASFLCRNANGEEKENDEEEADSPGDVHNLNHHCFIAYSVSMVPARIVRRALVKSKPNLREADRSVDCGPLIACGC